jgi:hypothetical protein
MAYWELVTRSFKISWRHRYLWLLALFAGESGGGFNFSSSSTPGTNGRRGAPDLVAINQQVSQWLSGHIGLIVAGDPPAHHRILRAGGRVRRRRRARGGRA